MLLRANSIESHVNATLIYLHLSGAEIKALHQHHHFPTTFQYETVNTHIHTHWNVLLSLQVCVCLSCSVSFGIFVVAPKKNKIIFFLAFPTIPIFSCSDAVARFRRNCVCNTGKLTFINISRGLKLFLSCSVFLNRKLINYETIRWVCDKNSHRN